MSDEPIDPTDDEEIPPQVELQQPTRNLEDVASERKRRKQIDNDAAQASKFWRDTFSTTVGRREMWKLLTAAQPDGNPFVPPFACGPSGFPQPEATWFRAGQYALGQHFYQTWLQHAREGVLAMLDEHDPRFVQQAAKRKQRAPD
jgi:hypothetical protein